MDEGNDFMTLLELQDSLEMITKTELLDQARKEGIPMSDRQLTALATDGLIPKSARIGSRSGAYPKVVLDQLKFVKRWRGRGMSVPAVKELLPIWRYMLRARRGREVSLAEFEFIARTSITLPEAWFSAPIVMQESLPCPNCTAPALADMTFLLKNGERQCVTDDGTTVSFGFVMFTEDEETHEVRKVTSMRMAVPGVNEETNPSSIILGIPTGVEIPVGDEGTHFEKVSMSTGPTQKGAVESWEGDAL